jgi:hypothetical protein
MLVIIGRLPTRHIKTAGDKLGIKLFYKPLIQQAQAAWRLPPLQYGWKQPVSPECG